MTGRDKKQHRLIRLSKVRAYLLIKTIKRKLKEQEKRIRIR